VNGSTWTASEVDFKAEGFATGNVTVDATVTDAAGNVANATQQTIVYDTLNQVFIAATQMDDNIVNGSESSNVTITGTSNGLDANTISVTITDGSTTTSAATGTSGTGTGASWTVTGIDISSLIEGTISVNVTVTDDAGNSATASKSLKYDESATISISSPIEGDGKVSSDELTTVLVTGTTTGVENNNDVTVTFSDGSNPDVTKTVQVASNAWTISGDEADLSSLTDGSITVTADVSDDAGNVADQASTTITLDRTVALAITSWTTAVNVSNSSAVAASGTTDSEAGNVVEIVFADADSVNTVTKNATVIAGTPNTWSISSVNLGGLNVGTGTVAVSVSDDAGNTIGTDVNNPVSQSFLIDNTAPLITYVNLASSNTDTDSLHVKEGETVTLTMNFDDDLTGSPTVVFQSGNVDITNSGSITYSEIDAGDNIWTAAYTVDGGDTEGAVSFEIDFTDDAGNVGNAVTSTTNSSSVEVDLTDAVLTTVSLYKYCYYTNSLWSILHRLSQLPRYCCSSYS
ncbi:MAG: hypothetical protein RJQ14_27005, partial [Marinoscillum sp.]